MVLLHHTPEDCPCGQDPEGLDGDPQAQAQAGPSSAPCCPRPTPVRAEGRLGDEGLLHQMRSKYLRVTRPGGW